jgi:hypothetical protein
LDLCPNLFSTNQLIILEHILQSQPTIFPPPMKKIYFSLFLATALTILSFSTFSQSPACANFSGVFISDSLEQNLPEYFICSGSNIYLKSLNNPSAIPSGETYQWKKNGVNISGETTRKINITSEGLYSLTMTVGTCTATSSGIIVRQYLIGYHPYQISSNNITQACTGDSIKMSVPKGFGITYQWKKDNANIANTNTSTYKAIATGSYSLVATQGTCNFTSNSVSLNFSNSANPQITSNKNVICEGKTTTLKASNVNATHVLQWFKDGVAISSANKDSLVVSQTGNYFLQTTKGSCTGNSNAMNISITNLNLPVPQLQKDYSNAFETCANNVVKLKVKDYNDGDLTWLKDGNVLAGQTGTTLTARESGNYAVRYSGNELCFSQSDVVTVRITDVSTMSFAGNNFTVGSGQPATINYTFNGVAPIFLNVNNTYNMLVMYPRGNNYIDNPTATTTYSATNFANACGIGTFSNPATITVGTCSPATQVTLVNAFNNSVCIGGSKTISVSANGTSYQWQKDGVDIIGATSNNLSITNFNYTNIGEYNLKVTGTCGTITKGNIRINANYGDVVFAKLDYPAYTNSDILLTAFSGSNFGNASNAYRWAGPNGFTSTEQNPVIPNGTALNSGTYTVTATNAGGCVNYALLSVTVTTAPITLGNLGTTSFCPNGTLSVPFTTTLAIGTLYKVYLSDANGSFRYQTEIGTGMTSPIEITFPQYAQAGTRYRMRIVSTSPSATSSLSGYLSTDGQVLTISVKNLVGREISDGSICQGSALTGIISANQIGITYEWKKDGVIQTTNQSLRITQSGSYVASVQKTGCNNVSRILDMNFSSTVTSASYRVGNEYQCSGTLIIFRDLYYSDSATYQWKKDGNILLGETKDTLIANQTGTYRATITDKCTLTDSPYYFQFQSVVFSNKIKNEIISQQIGTQNRNILCGNNFGLTLSTLSENYKNPLAPYTYQWKKNTVNIANETRYYYSNIQNSGLYTLSITQGSCNSISNGININRVDTIQLGLMIPNYLSNEICQGMYTSLQIDVPSYSYNLKLYKDDIEIPISTIYSGPIIEVNETGDYSVGGSATGCVVLRSNKINIKVGDKLKPQLFTGRSYLCGVNGSIGSAQIGSWVSNSLGVVNYQWFRNNQPIAGSTNSVITTSQSGYYKIRIVRGSCNGFSDSVEIKSSPILPKPKISNFDGKEFGSSISLCNNSLLDLFGNKNDLNEIVYDSLYWKKDGQIFAQKSVNDSYVPTQSGSYSIIGKLGTCQTESDPVEIKIGEPITANITGSTSIYPGQKAKLNLNFTGGNAWSYQTSDVATGQTTSLSPTLKNVSPTMTQTYSITSVASNCGVGTITGNATLTVLPCPTDKTISLNSGNWNTSTTWTCGQIPTAAYDAIIENGHTVTLPNGYQGITKKLDLRGGLKQGVGAGVRVSN